MYIDYNQANWVELLPVAQLIYNSSKNIITGIILFFVSKGREPSIVNILKEIRH